MNLAALARKCIRILLPVACCLLPALLTPTPAQGKMISDTLVLYSVFDTVRGQTATEGFTLYNPTPMEIDLNGYNVASEAEGDFYTFAGGETIGAFGFITVLDVTTGNTVDYRDLNAADAASNGASDTIGLFLGGTGTNNVVDFWGLDVTGFYHGDKKETSPVTWTNNVWLYRNPAVMFNSLTTNVNDSPLLGGGGMINRPGLNDVVRDTRIPFTINLDTTVPPTRRLGYVDRMLFLCTAPIGSVLAGSDFTVFCTATVNFGKLTGSKWEATTYSDSIATAYTGSLAFGDFTASAGSIAGISGTETEFVNGKMNGNTGATMNLTTPGQITLFLSDAYCTGYTTIEILAQGDTLSLVLPVAGAEGVGSANTIETTVSRIAFFMRSSGDSSPNDGPASWTENSDTVRLQINNTDSSTRGFHYDTGVCTMTLTLRENGGETLIFSLVRGGVGGGRRYVDTIYDQVADTVKIVVDNTPPKLYRIGDTSLRNDSTVGATDQTVVFYVIDTGAAFDGNGSCTLYWHIDSGAAVPNDNTNYVEAGMNDESRGTWSIQATIPVSSLSPSVDTKIGFWWQCFDDVYNGTASIASFLSSPAYTANNPGTFTIDVPNVRDVVISEIMADGEYGEYVELYNTTGTTIELNGWTMSDAGTPTRSWNATFTGDDRIAPYGYFLVMSASYDTDGFTIADPANHDTFGVNDWNNGDDLQAKDGGETLTLRNAANAEIDSTGYIQDSFTCDWSSGNSTETATRYSFERVMTWAGGRLVSSGVGYDITQWETNTGKLGYGGRRNGTPGHHNSVNVPNIDTITPNDVVVQQGGRGEWDIVIRNGNIPFESNGRLVLQVPPGWTAPQGAASSPGYTTIASEDNGAAGGALDFAVGGQSVGVTFTAFPAEARVTLRYGDNASSRNGIAQASTTSGDTRQFFHVLFDTAGTGYEDVDDSDLASVGSWQADTIFLIPLDTYIVDTQPAANPQSFITSEYQITWTISDPLYNKRVYGAHVVASSDDLRHTKSDTMFPLLSTYSTFDGFYAPGTDSADNSESGWTNASGQFVFTVKVSDTVGPNNIYLRDTDFDPQGAASPETHVYTDSARLPVPVINEVGWDGEISATEFIEIYNPTHEVQALSGYRIVDTAAGEEIDQAQFTTIFSLNPFHYLVFLEAINTVQDSGGTATDSQLIDGSFQFSDGPPGETLVLLNSTAAFVDQMGTLRTTPARAYYNSNAAGASVPGNSSLERVYPNRAGNDSGSWSNSDSAIRYVSGASNGRGSPGRPNSRSLTAVTSRFFDRLDTTMGMDNGGQADATFDSADIAFVLKIASGDTQPNQQLGVVAIPGYPGFGIYNFGTSADSAMLVTLTPTGLTNAYGTCAIQVSNNSNNFSGTAVVRVGTPFGVPDTTFIVFDRANDSLIVNFRKSQNDITFASRETDLIVYVGFGDSISGLRRADPAAFDTMPLIRFRFHRWGNWTPFDTMVRDTNAVNDTYFYRLDLSRYGMNYNDSSFDTIVWQVTWRDMAGNYDTSPDTLPNLVTRWDTGYEYVEPNDTVDILGPAPGDTIGGRYAIVRIRTKFSSSLTCTAIIEYDSDATGNFVDSISFHESSMAPGAANFPDSTMILTSEVPGTNTYDIFWNVARDMPDTRIPNARLRVRCMNVQTGAILGETILSPLGISTVLADPPDTVNAKAQRAFTTAQRWNVKLNWAGDSLAKYYVVWRDTGNRNDTRLLVNVTWNVLGRDSQADNFGLTLTDTHVDTPPGARYGQSGGNYADTYYVWYVTSIDTYNNKHELLRGYGDSDGAEYIHVKKTGDSLELKGVAHIDTIIPGVTIIYDIAVSNTEGYSPAYNVRVFDYIPAYTDYKGTNVQVDTFHYFTNQTDINDTDYTRHSQIGDSDYIQVNLQAPFNAGDTARIRFRVIIR